MKKNKLVLIFLCFFHLGFSQDLNHFYEDYKFEVGAQVYMFGNDVKLRAQPNTESDVLSLLKIGESVDIVEQSNMEMEFDGINSPWYKVKARDTVGYVLGALIALDKQDHGNKSYLIALKQVDKKLYLKTRILLKDGDFEENISLLKTPAFSVKTSGNRGLKSIESILEVNYLAESCGVDGGGFYLFYDGSQLIRAMDYTIIADADLYWKVEKYTFPKEEGGVEGKIVYESEIGETKEYETDWTESKIIRRVLEWNGKELLPKMPWIPNSN